MSAPRKVTPAVLWQAAEATLVRFACEYPPGVDPDHDHRLCVLDDISYAADLLAQLAAAVANRSDDAILAALSSIDAALTP